MCNADYRLCTCKNAYLCGQKVSITKLSQVMNKKATSFLKILKNVTKISAFHQPGDAALAVQAERCFIENTFSIWSPPSTWHNPTHSIGDLEKSLQLWSCHWSP